MVTSRFTHASVLADDLAESVAFYEDVLGMERIPSPNFPGVEVEWLRCGNLTLHLFDREIEAAEYSHVGIHVDDFAAVYDAVVEGDLLSDFDDAEDAADADGGDAEDVDDLPTVYELPDGAVQCYIRDPTGNLVEINHHDVEALPERIRDEVVARADQVPQAGEAAGARLYLEELLAEVATSG